MTGAVRDLRQAFDGAFAVPPPATADAVEDFLAVTVGDDPCALRLRDVVHLSARPRIAPLAGRGPDLLGLTGVRGAILPVFSLAAVTGRPAAGATPRWLIGCGAGPDVSFALEDFERLLRVPAAAVRRADRTDPGRAHSEELVRDGAVIRTVIDLGPIVRSLMGRTFPTEGEQA